MNIMLYRCDHDRSKRLTRTVLCQDRLQIIDGCLHGLCTRDQLWQIINLLVVQLTHMNNTRDQTLINDLLRISSVLHRLLHKLFCSLLFTFNDRLEDLVSLLILRNCSRRLSSGAHSRFQAPAVHLSADHRQLMLIHTFNIAQICIRFVHQQIRCIYRMHQ